MKKLFTLLFPVLLLSLTACQQMELPEEPVSADGPEFSAKIEAFDAETKTALAGGNSVVWSAEDQIAVFQGTSAADKYQVSEGCEGTTEGRFGIVAKGESSSAGTFDANIAIYPYQDGLAVAQASATEYQITGVTIPSTQTYASGTFSNGSFLMAAVTDDLTDHTLSFKNLCGALKLQLKGTAKVKNIELKGNAAEALSGDATVTLYADDKVPSVTMSENASSSVTLDCGAGVQLNETTATDFLIALPPTAFEKGFTATITCTDGGVAKIETAKANPIRRSYIHSMTSLEIETSEIEPLIEMGAVAKSNGGLAANYYGKQYYRTGRYLKPTSKDIGISVSCKCEILIHQYDEDFTYIGYLDYTELSDIEKNTMTLSDDCDYFKLLFRKNSALDEFDMPEVTVSNVDKTEYFNVAPAGKDHQVLIIPVDLSSASEPDETTILDDYGLLRLPDTYSNTGEPTRLIIYCHGAGLNYTKSTTGFTGLDPEYFLAEGYAVMDMDGNPYDNSNTHGYISAAQKAYVAAYDWIIANYNIKTDGVFLAGRSMGGGMVFELLQSPIPVIAGCPCVPVCNTLWWWNYMNATRKTFCASKIDFTGEAPTWTNSKKLSDAELQYLYDNFEVLLECSPFWRGIEDLPDKDILFSVGKTSANTSYDESEANLYSSLSFRSKAPVKMFTCYEDTTVPYGRNAQLMYNMLMNAGVECELSLVHTDASSPHRYELEDSQAYIEVTTSYGETMQAPWVYVDMVKFWRRYE